MSVHSLSTDDHRQAVILFLNWGHSMMIKYREAEHINSFLENIAGHLVLIRGSNSLDASEELEENVSCRIWLPAVDRLTGLHDWQWWWRCFAPRCIAQLNHPIDPDLQYCMKAICMSMAKPTMVGKRLPIHHCHPPTLYKHWRVL